ncbi:MAG: prepilin-type N-terminal cleavage/methylation domain-containing protein [Phycisphaerae bacterium]|nr:prepilin-type N-terminal cleavage/methylation domain-containing protein [Phycisphaerae bacterium]
MSRTRRSGFTLVEILIVVIILGILAAIVIPQFTDASTNARTNSMTSSLQTVRSQLELYKVQHNDTYPTLDAFSAQMTGKTDQAGVAGGTLGPYLHDVPPNPFVNATTVGTGDYGSSAWYYNATTGEFRANDTEAHGAY